MTRVLIVGGDSLIGGSLATDLAIQGWDVIKTTRRAAELERQAVHLDLATINPETVALPNVDVAIFAAAMTRFAECRAAPDLARRVNLEAPAALARRFAKQGTRMILLSTSAVFDGSRPYMRADAPTSPTSVYGALKAETERCFLALGDQGSVVRLTKVLSPTNALISGWIAALRQGNTIEAFGDLRLAPITMRDVTVAIVAAAVGRGILQVSGSTDVSYGEIARHLARGIGRPESSVTSIAAGDRGVPDSDRPRHAALDATTLSERADWRAPDPFDLVDALFLGARLSR